MKGKFRIYLYGIKPPGDIGDARKKLHFGWVWGRYHLAEYSPRGISPFDNYIITALCELNMNFRDISKIFSENFFGLSKAYP